jgi:uncharacterized protein YbaR (Trm112 family)
MTVQAKRTLFDFLKAKPKREFDESMLEYLACPITREPLKYDAKAYQLVSETSGIRYNIHDGIPVLLPTEAIRPPNF